MGILWTGLTVPGTTWTMDRTAPAQTPAPVAFLSLADLPPAAFLPLPTAPAPIAGVDTIGGA